jgi:aromatic-L-amino-acid decarboxylase
MDQPTFRPSDTLDPSPDEVRTMGEAAARFAAEYRRTLEERPVSPRVTSAGIRAQLPDGLPEEGVPFDELLATFERVIVAGSRQNAHPRMFGYVASPGVAVAAVADYLASTLNNNLTTWRSSPAPVELERLAIEWMRQLVGMPKGAAGLFTSGGSLAHLTALAAARHARLGATFDEQGLAGGPRLTLYASSEVHHSVDKAAALLGLGRANVRRVAVDHDLRMDVGDLARRIADDRAAGAQPLAVIASAGTVVSGAVDPLAAIAGLAREQGLWFHVDACYGGFARLAPSARRLFEGIEEADSVALDPHKWLYLPVDCGCVLYRDPAAAAGAFALDADYTRVLQHEADEAFAFWDYGPELSRRFRALKVWMLLAHVGTRALGEAIEANLDCARHLAACVDRAPDFERLATVDLSIVCFRYLPESTRGRALGPEEQGEVDRFNERLLVALARDGSSYVSNATIAGAAGARFALRACVLNYRTTREDMEILLADARRLGRELEDRG